MALFATADFSAGKERIVIEFVRNLLGGKRPPPMVCDCPWSTLFVWATGDVSYCGRTPPKGSLARQSFQEFWNSTSVQRARVHFLQDRHLQADCMPTCNVLTAKRPAAFIGNYFGDHEARPIRWSEPFTSAQIRKSPARPAADRRGNRAVMQDEIRSGCTEVAAMPKELHVQISDFCSLRCPMCCCGIIEPAEKAKLTRVIPARVLEELNTLYPFLERIEILGGEPFDQPFARGPLRRIIEDVAACGRHKPSIKIATNGNNLTGRWIDFILEHDFVDILSFSIDSVIPDVYASTRIGGSLDKVLANIDRLRDRRTRSGRRRPQIYWTSVIGLHTYQGIPAFVKAARKAGAVRLDFQPMNPMGHPEFHARNNIFQERHVEHMAPFLKHLVSVDMDSNSRDIINMTVAFLRRAGRYEPMLAANPALATALAEMGFEKVTAPMQLN